MYFTVKSLSDAYITDRVIKNARSFGGNTGHAGTLDLFKIFGLTKNGSIPNNELSRLLIKFDYSSLKTQLSASNTTVADPSFKCVLNLFDVYGGQPNPANFSVVVYPLSQSFDEGPGLDVVHYNDLAAVNFLTASFIGGNPKLWFASGANAKGFLGSSNIDIITSGNLGAGTINFAASQLFLDGTENLQIDVTKIVSATLTGQLPDNGFRISFDDVAEGDNKTRFVKRFGTRHTQDSSLRPKVIATWDDSIRDNSLNLSFDFSASLFMYNESQGNLTNILSGTALTPVVGNNCLNLRFETFLSGTGTYTKNFIASQYSIGQSFIPGVYQANVTLPSADPVYQKILQQSGSVTFQTIWASLDGTVGFLSSSTDLIVPQAVRGNSNPSPRNFFANVTNLKSVYKITETPRLRVFIQDNNTAVILRKTTFLKKSVVPFQCFYGIRDALTNTFIVPFDQVNGSTRLSSDGDGLYFNLSMGNFDPGRVYTIDLLVVEGGVSQIISSVGAQFKIDEVV